MKPQTIEELRDLVAHIDDIYTGDYASVSRDLHTIMYYLNHLEEGLFSPSDVQEASFTLYRLAECFYKAHRKRREYQCQVIDGVSEGLDNALSEMIEDKFEEGN